MKSEGHEIAVDFEASRTTGGTTWPAADGLVHFLTVRDKKLLLGGSVLELGSGTGWAGLSLAAWIASHHHGPHLVYLTDQRAQLGLLQRNVERNKALVSNVVVHELDFLEPVPEEMLRCDWGLIVASDVVYTREVAEGLPRLLEMLLRKARCMCIMAHTLRRLDDYDNIFFQSMLDLGLRVAEVNQEDGTLGPTPFCDEIELFPEQRVAILQITLDGMK